MEKTSMKLSILILNLLAVVVHTEDGDWSPISSPILSFRPCEGDQNVILWFEPALQQKNNNRYYLYVKKYFPENSLIRILFDSQVTITFIVRTGETKYTRMSLSDGDTFALRFFVAHEGLGFIVKGIIPGVSPYLISLTVNNVEYCVKPIVGFLEQYAADPEPDGRDECGRRIIDQEELIHDGASTKPGDWPWHVALYRMDNLAWRYICGGTLISKNFVLTASHCVSLRGIKYSTEVISVELGKYNLHGRDQESTVRQVHEIIIHEQFNPRYFYNDIALLKLRTEVIITDYIRPACLWSSNDKQRLPNNSHVYGTVVGWGFDNSDTLSETLRQARMPIISEVDCIRSNPLFYGHALNENQFCAGYHNGTSACNGDSGGAFQVFIPDAIQSQSSDTAGTWHVKGIVSNTLALKDGSNKCDPKQYVIFTDIEKYRNWIDAKMVR